MDIKNKLWIFQANRILTQIEEQNISKIFSDFSQSWNAHGADLKSEFQILNHKFIIINVDENQTKASGCSIDSLTQCIRQIDLEYHLDLLNRSLVSYENSKDEIETISLKDFKEKIKNNLISSETWVYNLSVTTQEEFNDKFRQPLKDSWAKIYN